MSSAGASSIDASNTQTAGVASLTVTPSNSISTTSASTLPSTLATSILSSTSKSPVTPASSGFPPAPPIPASASSSSADDSGPNLATKIGIGAGVGVLILFIFLGAFLILRHRRKHIPPPTASSYQTERSGSVRRHDFDNKHPMVEAYDGSVLELKKNKKRSSTRSVKKARRNSNLATVSEEPGSRPLSWVPEGMERSRTVSPLASNQQGGHPSLMTTMSGRSSVAHPGPAGHLSFIPPGDHDSTIYTGEGLPPIPTGERFSMRYPGDRSSLRTTGTGSRRSSIGSTINASRLDALQTLSGENTPISPVDVASLPWLPRGRPPPEGPPIPAKNSKRYSSGDPEVIEDIIETMPAEAPEPPQWIRSSQIVDLGRGSNRERR